MHRDRVKSARPMGLFDATCPPAPRPRDFAQQTLVRFVRQLQMVDWRGREDRPVRDKEDHSNGTEDRMREYLRSIRDRP